MQVPLIQLQCGFKSYDWGKKGEASVVARFAAATPAEGIFIEEEKPYAELWMGTHPSNPSKDVATGKSLLDLIRENQMFLSPSVAARFGRKLPFLFKVLSIGKALSIQAHPNKKLAEELHARDPKNYPDENHKPEMAIAITPFEGLCGFRPVSETACFLEQVPALRQAAGEDTATEFISTVRRNENDDSERALVENKQVLQKVFAAIMSRNDDEVKAATQTLLEDASNSQEFAGGGVPSTPGHVLTELVTRLHRQFGPDRGLLVLFLLNLVKMEPGEAIYLRADDIHAYISGDIVECMANSDNVVRAGFTPKFQDANTLVSMLTYDAAPPESQKLEPVDYAFATLNRTAYSSGSASVLYNPPIDEFAVVRTLLRGGGAKATLDPIDGPSIVLCVAGRGHVSVGPTVRELHEGQVYFVGASAECVLEAEGGKQDEFITFKAFCEVEDHSNGEKS